MLSTATSEADGISLSQSIQGHNRKRIDISYNDTAERPTPQTGRYVRQEGEGRIRGAGKAKGNWIEAIFAKAKPESEKPTAKDDDLNEFKLSNDDDEEDDDEDLPEDLRTMMMTTTTTLTKEAHRRKLIAPHRHRPRRPQPEAEDISDEDDNY